ncbi:KR domain-containing protein [Xylaria palmicola]|nr:KR domain-containing protein [Xylaria palmicola]
MGLEGSGIVEAVGSGVQNLMSVLIQSVCGGVGLAALQIAQMIGAKIYCTVGSEEKIRFLEVNYDNHGVDVVLKSLSGDLIHASWNCVAEFSTMVEIGKKDFRRRANLMKRCVALIQSGVIRGPTIAKSFAGPQIQDAFRTMQAATHIGKIIVRFPQDFSILQAVTPKPTPMFRSDRSYLLVGGLGGLGRSVATWMVELGARSLIFMSAKEGPEIQDLLDDLHSQDCEVTLVAVSVTVVADVERAVNTAPKPVAGVVGMAVVLEDNPLDQMTFADRNSAVELKVRGTWNLHNRLPQNPGFFILFSSYSGIVGQLGQANYASANTFLDAFVQYRH